MNDNQIHKVLADAFIAEGVSKVYTLMGDANMHWSIAMSEKGAQLVHLRHEHSAVAAADGHARATGEVGVASVTCGPGYTQIATALTVAVRRGVPMIVFAGDTPVGEPFHNQQFDQAPLAAATGAAFVALRNPNLMLHDLRKAFALARQERIPVVVSVPLDLQLEEFPWTPTYEPSTELMPRKQQVQPDPVIIADAADMVRKAQRPMIIAGRGAIHAKAEIVALADKIGALLATTLCAKGLFDDHPFNVGLAGAFAHNTARQYFSDSDLVIGIGAGLGFYTAEGGYLYPAAQVIQIDIKPRAMWQGLKVADLHVAADAAAGALVLAHSVSDQSGYRSEEVRASLVNVVIDPKELHPAPGLLDPRRAMEALDAAIPKNWDMVTGVAHFFNWLTHLKGRPAERYFITQEFGAIGQGLPSAIGVAIARGDGKTVLVEGDGSFLMHIQELEVLSRQRIKLLVLIFNDGAYAAETHKLTGQGVDPAQSVFGRPNFSAIAQGFGIKGKMVRSLDELTAAILEHIEGDGPTVIDIPIPDDFPSIQYRRLFHGEM